MSKHDAAIGGSLAMIQAMLMESIESISFGVPNRTLYARDLSNIFLEVRSALKDLSDRGDEFSRDNMVELGKIYSCCSSVSKQFDSNVDAGLMMGMDVIVCLLAGSLYPLEIEADLIMVALSPQCREVEFDGEFDDVMPGPWFEESFTSYSNWMAWYRNWELGEEEEQHNPSSPEDRSTAKFERLFSNPLE
jgi:hypothetical protein